MFSTSSLYFLVAIFGESIESSEAHGLQMVEGQEDETTESRHNDKQVEAREIQNESGESTEQRLQEEQAPGQNTNEFKHLLKETEETLHQETSENQRRVLELPLSISAGIGYAERLWMARGSIEGIVTASFFGAAAIAAAVGLSPIVGSFSVGMAVASTRLIKRVEEYVDKLEIIFAPLFFAIIGAQVKLTGVNLEVIILSAIIIVVPIVSKLIGCGLPALIFLRNRSKALRVGIGMVSRGEVGLILSGIGVTSGALSSNIYTTVIIMVAITTLITPAWLKKEYSKEQGIESNV
jgi:hypothetical protein